MINGIPVTRANILVKLCRDQNIFYRRTCTRHFISPAAIISPKTCINLNFVECHYLKNNQSLKNVNNFKINQSILPLIKNRNFCTNKKNTTTSYSNSNTIRVDENKVIQSQEQQEFKLNIEDEFPKKISIFAKFKLMYKKYWYVLIPVHLVTSAGWFFGFYFLSQSGVDIPTFLEHLRVSDLIIDKVRDSKMGHYAIAYLCYKLATPLRYAVTLGGTTVSIRYLVRFGYIKPVPTKQQVIDKFKKAKDDMKQDFKQRRDERAAKKAANVASKRSKGKPQ